MHKKRTIFLIIILISIVGIVSLLFASLKEEEGENTDNNNGNTVLPKPPKDDTESLSLGWIKTFPLQNGTTNIAIEIENPNAEWGANDIEYTATLLDNRGEEMDSIYGNTYILPNEKKYIAMMEVSTQNRISEVQFAIESVDWVEINDFVRLNLEVENPKIEEIEGDTRFTAKAVGRVANNSFFGLTNIEVVALLIDNEGDVVDINRTSINTVLEEEKRDAEMFWPYNLPMNRIDRVDIRAYSNVMENQNFIRQYGV